MLVEKKKKSFGSFRNSRNNSKSCAGPKIYHPKCLLELRFFFFRFYEGNTACIPIRDGRGEEERGGEEGRERLGRRGEGMNSKEKESGVNGGGVGVAQRRAIIVIPPAFFGSELWP